MNRTDTIRRVAKEIQLDHSGRLGPAFFHGPLMLPFLQDGDLLVVAPIRAEEVRVGDIVTYRDAEKFPTVRVIGRSARGFLLKADNFPKVCEMPGTEILGRVVERRRGDQSVTRGSLQWTLFTWFILLRQRYRDFRAGA